MIRISHLDMAVLPLCAYLYVLFYVFFGNILLKHFSGHLISSGGRASCFVVALV